jgi:hypothetical protein
MRRGLLTIWIVLLGAFSMAQPSPKNVKEKVSLHVNRDELIAGETLIYSAFVRSAVSGQLTSLSKILYVELLDHEGNPVYQAKIPLNEGRGQGEYFVSSVIATGNYHLVAYTRWMKNFGDFYYQPVTIINPFEDFPITKSPSSELTIGFFPDGGAIKSNIDNRIVVYASQGSKEVRVQGRVVSSTGALIANVQTNQLGLGSFNLSPSSNEKYQLIVENESGNFSFFELPEPCDDCVSLIIRESTNDIKVTVDGPVEDPQIVIRDFQNVLVNQKLSDDRSMTLSKKDLPKGLVRFEMYEDKVKKAVRNFFVGEKDNASTDDLGSYEKRSLISTQLDVPKGSRVSVSVSRIFDENREIVDQEIRRFSLGRIRSMSLINDQLLVHPMQSFQYLPNEIRYLPERRHDFVTGRIVEIDDKSLPVALSLPGEDFQFQMSNSQKDGQFTIGLMHVYRDRNAFLKVVGEEANYTIQLEDEFYTSFPEFYNHPVQADSARIAQWARRSVQNQIENAYYELRPDSLFPLPESANQFEINSHYILDDYTRFPTLRDTFIEYIPEVGVRKKEEDYRMNIRLNQAFSGINYPSLVLLDGLPVLNKEVLDISPYAIKGINILNQRFYFGEVTIDGIISFETIDKDYAGINTNALQVSFKGLERTKSYQHPDHANSPSKIPDLRTQIYWDPMLTTQTDIQLIQFFGSDLPGKYLIEVKGVDPTGHSILERKVFELK